MRRKASLQTPQRMRSERTGFGRILCCRRFSNSALVEGSSRSSSASVAAPEEGEDVARICHHQHKSTELGNAALQPRGRQPAGEPFCRAAVLQGKTLPQFKDGGTLVARRMRNWPHAHNRWA